MSDACEPSYGETKGTQTRQSGVTREAKDVREGDGNTNATTTSERRETSGDAV